MVPRCRVKNVVGATPKIVSAAIALAALAWLLLLGGLIYANFVVVDLPPNVVISFSDKGLTRLLVELSSLAVGCLGLLLVLASSMSS